MSFSRDTHIVYCSTDGRFIALAQNVSAANALYRALAETTVLDEQYGYELLVEYLRKHGFQADAFMEKLIASKA